MSPIGKPFNPDNVAQAWGADAPDWIVALARACDESSVSSVARKLDRSPGLVSQALRRKYPGNMAALEERVRGRIMDERIICPVLGEIALTRCCSWREKAETFLPTNQQRVQMYTACRGCQHFNKETDE